MPNNKLITLAKARIEMLFAAGRAALGLNDSTTYDLAVEQLGTSSQDISIPAPMREVAGAYRDKLGMEAIDQGLVKLEDIVSKLDAAMDEMNKAIDIAKSGEEGLAVPAAANAAKQALSSFDKLQKSVDKAQKDLKATVASNDPVAASASLKALMADLAELNDSLRT